MKKIENNQDLTKKYGINKNFILSVGTIQPRKNYEKLIAAFAELLKNNRTTIDSIDLVIIGKKGWLYEETLEAPEKYHIKDKVHFLEYVPDEDLPWFYKSCLCFVMTSLYEGFELPALEAMSYQAHLVLSNVSSLPEIGGEAAIYIDPNDINSIYRAIQDSIIQRNTRMGESRIEKGKLQVKKFTWENTAEITVQTFKKLLKI